MLLVTLSTHHLVGLNSLSPLPSPGALLTGVLHCVDDLSHEDTTAHLVQDTAARLGLDTALQLHVGDAWELHRTMDPALQFDLCWFDFGVGRKVDEFLGHWWPRVRPAGGLVLLHSTLTNSLTRRWLDGKFTEILSACLSLSLSLSRARCLWACVPSTCTKRWYWHVYYIG